MIVKINSLDSQRTFDASWVEIKTTSGELVILEGHAPIIASVKPERPIIIMLKNGEQELIHIQKQTILELSKNVVTIIL